MSETIEKVITVNDTSIKVTIRHPKEIKNGIVLYGHVLSFSAKDKFYGVIKRHTGKGRFSYNCQCDGNFFRRKDCVHIHSFKLAEKSL